MAGDEGFEPPNGGVKVRCLTAWRIPKVRGPKKAGALYENLNFCQKKNKKCFTFWLKVYTAHLSKMYQQPTTSICHIIVEQVLQVYFLEIHPTVQKTSLPLQVLQETKRPIA